MARVVGKRLIVADGSIVTASRRQQRRLLRRSGESGRTKVVVSEVMHATLINLILDLNPIAHLRATPTTSSSVAVTGLI
jgi:hypothetical protein